ncbi:MAG TPA: prolyl oligopeptidase family serine peptidase [Candidatus Dormibacteraeota bacterium]|nr:prolyl oligopeptidase family serine peptidase [Candidatus Dormibacteraeota bacterium]
MPATLGADDLYRFRWIDHVRLSRDGERIAYQLSWADAESRQSRSRVVVRRLLDQEPVDATAGPRRDHSPEWSPDGRQIAFMSKRGAEDQVFVLDVASGGDARQVSSVPEGAAGAAWSPDGSLIAFIGLVVGDPDAVVDDPRPPEGKEQVRRPPVARVVRRLDYKHDGQGYIDGRYHHVFVVPAGGGDATQVTGGAWDVAGFDWSPDGTKLVVSGNAEPGSDLQRGLNLYLVDLAGKREKLTGGFDIASPTWSPRGDLIAFVAPNGLDAGLIDRLWVVPAAGGNPRCLTIGLDQSVGDSVITDMRGGHGGPRLCWSKDGDRLYFQSSGPGVSMIYSNDLEGNVWPEVGGQRRIFDFDVASGVFAFCASDTTNPGELHILMQGAEARLTDLNPWLRERYVAQPERHQFTAPDGWVIEGWVLKPQDFDAGRRYPLVMEVHGGPHAQYGWAFFHELQILAGMGYLVLYVNPRGSDGYGERFEQAVVRDWGGKDYIDLMTALDQLIERIGCVDTKRMGIGGGSYGGFMTNWVIGQTDRFAAAVAMRSISNLVSEYSQHDIVIWGALELGPPPYPDLDELWRRSPIRYVQEIKTPLLLTCGEMDLRCAISQSEELFGAMRLLGKTVELVRFPDESHDLSRSGRPDRRVERLRRIAGWYERFLGTASSEPVVTDTVALDTVALGTVALGTVAVDTVALATAVSDPVAEADTQLLETREVSSMAAVSETVPPARQLEAVESEADPEAIELAPEIEPEPVAVAPEPEPEAALVSEDQAVTTTQTLGLRSEDADAAPVAEPAPLASEPPVAEPEFESEAAPVFPEPEPVFTGPAGVEPAPVALATEPVAAAVDSPESAPEPPVAEPQPVAADPVAETIIAWPHGTAPGLPSNGAQSDTSEEATSIIPAWQPSDAPPESKQTVSLAAVPPEVVAAGTGFPAKLTFESGPFAGRIIALPDQMVSVGRAPDNDIVVGDPATSGRHGRIEVRGGAFWISDLGSTNGTLVNGEPIIEKQLAHGDVIAIGQNIIRFTLET